MIKIIKLFATSIFAIMIIQMMACNKYLDVIPDDRFLSEDVYKSEISTHNVLNGIYLNMAKPQLYGGQLTMGIVDIMAQYYKPVQAWISFTNYTYNEANVQDVYTGIWNSAYKAILNTNSFLDNVGKANNILSESRKQLLMGEAYGMRAFIHFDMLRLFGPIYVGNPTNAAIPYLSSPTEKIQPILPASNIIDSVLLDLKRAEELLKNDPIRTEGVVNISGIDPIEDFYKLRNRRMNYYAVLALKARVLLYKEDKNNALLTAQQLIQEAGKWFPWSNGDLSLPGIQNPDRTFSSEVIFGLQNYDMYNQQRSLFAATLDISRILAPSPERLETFYENNPSDYRRRINWVSGAAAGKAFETFVKYQDVVNQEEIFRNFQPLIRLSEIYYIAAECSSDPEVSIAYINAVRANRGLGELNRQVVIDDALESEYRKEFWGEGQLFYYYKRHSAPNILSGEKDKTVQMNASKYVVPLPLSEIQNR